MAVIWLGALAFTILIFVVTGINQDRGGYRSVGPPQPPVPPRQHPNPPIRMDTQVVLFLLFVLFLAFVAGVLVWAKTT